MDSSGSYDELPPTGSWADALGLMWEPGRTRQANETEGWRREMETIEVEKVLGVGLVLCLLIGSLGSCSIVGNWVRCLLRALDASVQGPNAAGAAVLAQAIDHGGPMRALHAKSTSPRRFCSVSIAHGQVGVQQGSFGPSSSHRTGVAPMWWLKYHARHVLSACNEVMVYLFPSPTENRKSRILLRDPIASQLARHWQ